MEARTVFPVGQASGSGTAESFVTLPSNTDNQQTAISGLQGEVARIYGYNPVADVWDRIACGGDAADARPVGSVGHVFALAHRYSFNGTAWDRNRTNSAAVLAGTTQPFAALSAAPGQWTLTHAPAANTQATATRAAGAAGVRHVLNTINASITAVAAIAAPLTVVVRDGATGVGTILWQDRLTAPAGNQDRVTLSGLNIVGSAATAMTVEFTAGPGATNFETLSATGYSTV